MEDFEENYDLECSHCGHSPIRTRDCDSCEDGIKDDLYEEDPLWYSPGEWESCRECAGTGHLAWCPNCGEDYEYEEYEDEDGT